MSDVQPPDFDWFGGDDPGLLDVVEEQARRHRGGWWWWASSAMAATILVGVYWGAGMWTNRTGDVPGGEEDGVIEQRVPGVALPRTDEDPDVPDAVDDILDGIGGSGGNGSGGNNGSGGDGPGGNGSGGNGSGGNGSGGNGSGGDGGSGGEGGQPGTGDPDDPDPTGPGGGEPVRPTAPDDPNVVESDEPVNPRPRPTTSPTARPTEVPTTTPTPTPVPTTTPTTLPTEPPLPSPSPTPTLPALPDPIQLRDFTAFGPQNVKLYPIDRFDPPWAARTSGRLHNPNAAHGAVDLYLECGQLGALDSCASGTAEAEQFDDLMFRICVEGDASCHEGPMASFRVDGITVPPFGQGRNVTFWVWLKDTGVEQQPGVTTPFNIVIRSLVG